MEPVEIDIRMKQNVDTESKKSKQGIEELNQAVIKVKSDIERHAVAVNELKKDLVGLGMAYKKATSKEQKSEILTEIELTKKNILDGKEAMRQLKAEMSSMSKVKPTAVMPDANQVGKAAVGYNSLNFSTQQLVRELPAATMGLNMFFLAISNNIPVLTDGIKRARAENELLKASGASITPVWKQLFSSILSWQSLMMVGITIFSMYGKQIFSAFSKGSEAADRAKETIKKFNDSFSQSVAEPLAKVNQLSDRWNKLGDNLEEKKKFIDANKEAFHDLGVEVNNVKDAENLLNDNLPAFQSAMMARAMSIASMDVATEKYKEYFKKMREAEKLPKTKTYNIMEEGTGRSYQYVNPELTEANKVAKELKTEGDKYITESNKQNDTYLALLEKAGIKKIVKEKTIRERSHTAAYNSESDFQKLIYSLTEKSESMLIGLKEDSLAKRLEIIQQEKDKELAAIREKEIAIIDEYNRNKKKQTDDYNRDNPKAKKTFTALSTKPEDIPASLTAINPAQAKQLADATLAVENAYREKSKGETQKWYDELTALGVKYGDEITKIREDYFDRIDKLTKAQASTEDLNRKKELQTSIDSLVSERDAKISTLTAGIIKETELYKLASDDKLQVSKETTDALIADLKRRIDAEIAAGNLSAAEGKKMLDKVSQAQKLAEGDKNQNNPFAQLGTAISNKKAYDNAKADPNTSIETLAKLESQAGATTASMAGAAGAALAGVKGILGSVVDGMDRLGMLTDEEKKDAENIIGMVGGAADLAMGIASGNPVQIIQGSIDLLVNAFEYFDYKSKDIEKAQKKAKQNIDDLTRAYDRLQRSVDKALGTDVYARQKDQVNNLKKQIAENNALIALELQKKKKKQDAEAIQKWKDETNALNDQIEDITKSISEDLAQTSAKDLAQQVGDAIMQGIVDGSSSGADVMGDVINSVLKNAVSNALEKQFLEKQMGKATDYLASAMEDGKLSDSEKKQFSEMVTAAGNNYNEALSAYKDILGSSDTAREGAKKGIATASQDSIDELTGGVYALRMGVADIRNNTREQTLIIRTITNQLDTLIDNTEPIAEMAEDIKNMSNDISDIKTRGLNVKV